MKKIFYLASIAALAFSSCAKDETTGSVMGTVGGSKIKAAVEADDTRTHLEEVDGKYEFRWSKNDILGVYGDGENSAPNVAFTLLDSSIDQAAGVFESNYKLLEGDNYVAYYPYQPGSKMVPTWTKGVLNPETIELSISAKQNYAPASFNTLTAPAISDSFVLDEDGNADVTMQPVADYLFVNMMSTEPIQKLTLKLFHEKYGWLNIAGQGTLKPYTIKDTKTTRYFLSSEGMDQPEIVLNSGQLTGAVCHEPNVYVFTVPAGILGTNQPIMARIIVNNGEEDAEWVNGKAYFDTKSGADAPQLNGGVVKGDGKTTKDQNVYREFDKETSVASRRLENTVFWANPMVDTDGDGKNDARGSFLYNPEEAFIIRNEVDFLKYMNEYADEDSEECYGKDAFVCSEYEFDFSEENMGKLATQVKEEYLRAYISDYIANGMPCISVYDNDFRGNGATLKAITKLQSWCGLFGIITPDATINNVTFEDIEAAESPVLEELSTRGATGNYDQFILAMSTILDEGFILGTVVGDNEKANNINKVTVKNAKGGAVFGGATVAAFNGVTYEGVAGLNSIVAYLAQNADLDMTKTWDVVKGVKGNVFGMIKAVPVTDSKQNVDGHHVVTIAKGGSAEYQKLASIIYVAGLQGDTTWLADLFEAMEDEDFDLEALEEFIDDWAEIYYYGDAGYFGELSALAWEDDDCATSVVIENVSYWTGDYIAPTFDAKAKNYPVAYAEQLAVGIAQMDSRATTRSSDDKGLEFVLQRDINLNYENNNTLWEMAELDTDNYAVINGNKKTITGFVMQAYGDYYVAPFNDAYEIKDLTVNGVDITILTNDSESISVPKYVSGLVDYTVKGLTNVTVNGINFDAYDISGGFNSMDDPYYYPEMQTFIGWVAGWSEDAQYTNVKANVTSSKLMGVSGLVGVIELYSVTESHFEGCSLTTGKIAQEALTDFVPVAYDEMFHNGKKWTLMNAAGSMVGFVYHWDPVAKSIEFNNSGAPKFIYDAGDVKDNTKINVLYNDKNYKTLLGLENYPSIGE